MNTALQMCKFADHPRSMTASTSLLRRVRSRDQDAWRRLVGIYGPLVYRWARTSGLQAADAEDIVGEVFIDVLKGVDRFKHDGNPHSFRRWLRTMSARKVLKHVQRVGSQPVAAGGSTAQAHLQGVAAQALHEEAVETRDEVDWLRQRALKILQDLYKPEHWQVFQRTVLEGAAPADVAQAAGMTVWAVYKVRARVLHRLRAELDELS